MAGNFLQSKQSLFLSGHELLKFFLHCISDKRYKDLHNYRYIHQNDKWTKLSFNSKYGIMNLLTSKNLRVHVYVRY